MNRRDFLRWSAGSLGVLVLGGYARDAVASDVPRSVGPDFQRRFDQWWDYAAGKGYLAYFGDPDQLRYNPPRQNGDKISFLRQYEGHRNRLQVLVPMSEEAALFAVDRRFQSGYPILENVFWGTRIGDDPMSPSVGDLYELFVRSERFAGRAKDRKLAFSPEEQADLAARIGDSESLGWLTKVVSAAGRHLLYLEGMESRPADIEAYLAGDFDPALPEAETRQAFDAAHSAARGPIREFFYRRERALSLARGGVDAIEAERRKNRPQPPGYLAGVDKLETSVQTECVSAPERYQSLGDSWEFLAKQMDAPGGVERALVHLRRLQIQTDDPGEQGALGNRIERLEKELQPPGSFDLGK